MSNGARASARFTVRHDEALEIPAHFHFACRSGVNAALRLRHTGFRPEMTRSKTTTMAMTRRTWMKPPIVAPVTSPSSHRMSSTIAIVYNIKFSFGWLAGWRAGAPASHESKVYLSAGGTATVMLLTTLVTPLMSVASLVTRLFSASFLATPLKVTTPSVVETPV